MSVNHLTQGVRLSGAHGRAGPRAGEPGTTRAVYGRPHTCDHARGIIVGVIRPAAERIGAGEMDTGACAEPQTAVADLRGVRRGHEQHRHARIFRFVGNELPELVAGPGIVPSPLLAASWLPVGARAYPRQVFQGDRLPVLAGVIDQPATDDVVLVSLEARLPPAEPVLDRAHASAARASALVGVDLEEAASGGIVVTNGRHPRPIEAVAVTGDGQLAAFHVHTQHSIQGCGGEGWGGAREVEVEVESSVAVAAHGRARGLAPCTFLAMVGRQTQGHRDPAAAFQSKEVDGSLVRAQGHHAQVVVGAGGTERAHSAPALSSSRARGCHAIAGSHSKLGRNPRCGTHLSVGRAMQARTGCDVGRRPLMGCDTGGREARENRLRRRVLLRRWIETTYERACDHGLRHGNPSAVLNVRSMYQFIRRANAPHSSLPTRGRVSCGGIS